jgi:hypothetical protein
MMAGVDDLLAAAAKIEAFLALQGWQFCFIGGVAVQRWAEPRFTKDIDLTLLSGFGDEEKFIDILLQELDPRRPDAREFALRSRVLFARTRGGPESTEVDIALGALPFESRTIERASLWTVRDGLTLTTCSAEDLVVHKVFASRDLDWSDVERVLIRQHGKLNLNLVQSELEPLLELKGELDALDKLERTRAIVERRLKAKP